MSGYRDAEHQRAAYLARKHRRGGISDTTWYTWRRRWEALGIPADEFEQAVVQIGLAQVKHDIRGFEAARAAWAADPRGRA